MARLIKENGVLQGSALGPFYYYCMLLLDKNTHNNLYVGDTSAKISDRDNDTLQMQYFLIGLIIDQRNIQRRTQFYINFYIFFKGTYHFNTNVSGLYILHTLKSELIK